MQVNELLSLINIEKRTQKSSAKEPHKINVKYEQKKK